MRQIVAPMVGGFVTSTVLTFSTIAAIYGMWKGEVGIGVRVPRAFHFYIIEAPLFGFLREEVEPQT